MTEQPPHASAEMAKIILDITSAIQRDENALEIWKKRTKVAREKEQEEWEHLSETEKLIKQRAGNPISSEGTVSMRRFTRAIRRKIRYKIFRLREGKWETDKELAALKSWFEKQFQAEWNFADFTFLWDISAIDPLKVVTPFEWDGDVVPGVGGKMCDPSAFTKQKM